MSGTLLRSAVVGLFVVVFGAPVRGQEPARYSFAVPPLEVVDRLAKADLGKVEPFSPDDRAVLDRIWQAHKAGKPVSDADTLTAFLIASGVTDPKHREQYVKKYEALVEEAKKAVAEAKDNREKADKLLRFLHAGVMAKGYDEKQTTLSGVFDTGTYNCVSSAGLYQLVGTRLGLTLRPILIEGGLFVAGHAAADLIDGDRRIQVEPTNPDGFDWETKLKQPGVVTFGPRPDRSKAVDADTLALAASIASNRGVAASRAEPADPVGAVRCYAVALCLAPTAGSAPQNLTAELTNWGVALSKAGKWEEAVRAYDFGAAVAPDARDLRHNQEVVWSRYIDAELDAGRDEAAAKLLTRAAAAVPGKEEFKKPAPWFVQAAYRVKDKDGWSAALTVADRGLKILPEGDSAAELKKWKVSAHRRWSQDLLEKGDVDGSFKVLREALAADPEDRDLLAGLGYHTQEALAHLHKTKGSAAAVAHFEALRKEFPKAGAVTERGAAHARRVVGELTDAKKWEDALSAAEACKPFVGGDPAELAGRVYDAWGRSLADDKKWEDALKKYAEGRELYPKTDRLAHNSIAVADRWARTAMDKNDWKEAIRIYDVALSYFPGDRHLEHNKAYCLDKLGK